MFCPVPLNPPLTHTTLKRSVGLSWTELDMVNAALGEPLPWGQEWKDLNGNVVAACFCCGAVCTCIGVLAGLDRDTAHILLFFKHVFVMKRSRGHFGCTSTLINFWSHSNLTWLPQLCKHSKLFVSPTVSFKCTEIKIAVVAVKFSLLLICLSTNTTKSTKRDKQSGSVSKRRGNCSFIWLSAGNLTRPGHDWQIDGSFSIQWVVVDDCS